MPQSPSPWHKTMFPGYHVGLEGRSFKRGLETTTVCEISQNSFGELYSNARDGTTESCDWIMTRYRAAAGRSTPVAVSPYPCYDCDSTRGPPSKNH
jgi:hypothetical protein